MQDPFSSYFAGLEAPGEFHFQITPNDSEDLPTRPRAIRVGDAGDIVVRDEAGTAITYTVAAGEVLTFRAIRILASGTTATNLVGWY